MVPLDKIRSDLKEIRYYYSRKAMFDECKNIVIGSSIMEKVRRYNEAVKTAPPRLYDMYMMLYVKGYTDCFSDYFNDMAKRSKTGLMDYIEYVTEKATVDELKMQNSYFINSLYGNAGNGSA